MEASAAGGMTLAIGAELAPSEQGTAQGSDEGDPLPNSLLASLAHTQPLITPNLVAAPVTGAGNGDFWQVHCEPGDDRAECPAGDRED